MMVRRRRLALLVVPLLALTAACTSGDDDPTSAGANGQELKIGLLTPLKGPNARAGVDADRGAKLAADVINGLNPSIPLSLAAAAGLPNLGGAKVSIVTADANATDSDQAQTVSGTAINRLVSVEGVNALVGAYDSQVTQYASQRSERYEVPFVNADSPATFLTDAGRDWFFRIGPSWESAGESFLSLLRERSAAAGKIAVLHVNDSAGQNVVTTVRNLAQQAGTSPDSVLDKPYPASGANYQAIVDDLRGANPDTVFLYVTPTTVGPLTRAFQVRNYKPRAMISLSLGYLTAADFAANPTPVDGLMRSVSWSTEAADRNPAARAVTGLYQRRYNSPMTESAASAFTAVMTVAQAANDAGGLDNTRIRSALLNLNVPGDQTIMPWAGIRFDETHQNVLAESLIEQFSKRAFHVVYPSDVSSAELVYPAPNSSGT